MKECLNCKKEYEAKRPHSKFCSASCRVMYNRKNPVGAVSKTQVQVLYNELLDIATQLKSTIQAGGLTTQQILPVAPDVLIAAHNEAHPEQHSSIQTYDYNGLRELITASTSSFELEVAWKAVGACKELANWQKRELTRLKEDQRTKIDF